MTITEVLLSVLIGCVTFFEAVLFAIRLNVLRRKKSFGTMFIVEPKSPDSDRLVYLVVDDKTQLAALKPGDTVNMKVMIDDEISA